MNEIPCPRCNLSRVSSRSGLEICYSCAFIDIDREMTKLRTEAKDSYERGRADALKELASGRTLWTTSCNLKAIESGGDCEINVWTFKPGITDLVPVKLVKMEVSGGE